MEFENIKIRLKNFLNNRDSGCLSLVGDYGIGKTNAIDKAIDELELKDKVNKISLLGLDQETLIDFMMSKDRGFFERLPIQVITRRYKVEAGYRDSRGSFEFEKRKEGKRYKKGFYAKIETIIFDDCESYKSDSDTLIRLCESLIQDGKKVILVYNKRVKKDADRIEEKLQSELIELTSPNYAAFKSLMKSEKIKKFFALNISRNMRILKKVNEVRDVIDNLEESEDNKKMLEIFDANFPIIYFSFDRENIQVMELIKKQLLDEVSSQMTLFNDIKREQEEQIKKIESMNGSQLITRIASKDANLSFLLNGITSGENLKDKIKKLKNKNEFKLLNSEFHHYVDKIMRDVNMDINPHKILSFKITDVDNIQRSAGQMLSTFWQVAFICKEQDEKVAQAAYEFLQKHKDNDFLFFEAFTSASKFSKYIDSFFRKGLYMATYMFENDEVEGYLDWLSSIINKTFNYGKSLKLELPIISLVEVAKVYDKGHWKEGDQETNSWRTSFKNWTSSKDFKNFLTKKVTDRAHDSLYLKISFLKTYTSAWNEHEEIMKNVFEVVDSLKIKNNWIKHMITKNNPK